MKLWKVKKLLFFFLTEASSTGGKNNLFYGVDAPWTAYTKYVSKTDGTLTVQVRADLLIKMMKITIRPSKDCSGFMAV